MINTVFFKLNNKEQIGSSSNAVRWQVWMRLLVHLLMRFLRVGYVMARDFQRYLPTSPQWASR